MPVSFSKSKIFDSLILYSLMIRCDNQSTDQSATMGLAMEIWSIVSSQAIRCNQEVRQSTNYSGFWCPAN